MKNKGLSMKNKSNKYKYHKHFHYPIAMIISVFKNLLKNKFTFSFDVYKAEA